MLMIQMVIKTELQLLLLLMITTTTITKPIIMKITIAAIIMIEMIMATTR